MESRARGDVFYQKSLTAKKWSFNNIKAFLRYILISLNFWCLSSLPNSNKLKIEWNALKETFLFCSWEQLFKSILKKGQNLQPTWSVPNWNKIYAALSQPNISIGQSHFFQTVNLPKYRKKYSFPLQYNSENTDVLVFCICPSLRITQSFFLSKFPCWVSALPEAAPPSRWTRRFQQSGCIAKWSSVHQHPCSSPHNFSPSPTSADQLQPLANPLYSRGAGSGMTSKEVWANSLKYGMDPFPVPFS